MSFLMWLPALPRCYNADGSKWLASTFYCSSTINYPVKVSFKGTILRHQTIVLEPSSFEHRLLWPIMIVINLCHFPTLRLATGAEYNILNKLDLQPQCAQNILPQVTQNASTFWCGFHLWHRTKHRGDQLGSAHRNVFVTCLACIMYLHCALECLLRTLREKAHIPNRCIDVIYRPIRERNAPVVPSRGVQRAVRRVFALWNVQPVLCWFIKLVA